MVCVAHGAPRSTVCFFDHVVVTAKRHVFFTRGYFCLTVLGFGRIRPFPFEFDLTVRSLPSVRLRLRKWITVLPRGYSAKLNNRAHRKGQGLADIAIVVQSQMIRGCIVYGIRV